MARTRAAVGGAQRVRPMRMASRASVIQTQMLGLMMLAMRPTMDLRGGIQQSVTHVGEKRGENTSAPAKEE